MFTIGGGEMPCQNREASPPLVPSQSAVDLLFVSEDGNLGKRVRSQSATAKAIHRHVQLVEKRAQKVRKTRVLQKSSAATRRIAQQGFSVKIKDGRLDQIDHRNRLEDEEEVIEIGRGDGATAMASSNDVARPAILKTHPSPGSMIGSPIDSFGVSDFTLDAKVLRVLTYYLQFSIMGTFKGEAVCRSSTGKNHRYYPLIQTIVRDSMANKMHMYALLAVMAGRMVHTVDGAEQDATQFVLRTIQAMRSHFSSTSEEVTSMLLLDMLYLCIAEWYRSNYSAAVTHLKVVFSMSSKLDVSKPLDRYVWELIHFYDVFIALDTGNPPVLPLIWQQSRLSTSRMLTVQTELAAALRRPRERPLWDPRRVITVEDGLRGYTGPLSILKQNPKDYEARLLGREPAGAEQRPGRGFLEAIECGVFSSDLKKILPDLVTFTDVITYSVVVCHDPPRTDVEWINRAGVTLLRGLASTRAAGLEECVRLATIIMLCQPINPMAWRTSAINLYRLKQAITELESRSMVGVVLVSRIRTQLLFWAVAVGLFVAAAAPKEEEWFMKRAYDMAKRLELTNYLQLHRLMGRFIHADTQQFCSLSKLASRLNGAH